MKVHKMLLKRQRMGGFTLVEMGIVLAVFSSIAVAVQLQRRQDAITARAEAIGTGFLPYDQALDNYVRKNRAALQTGAAIAGVANPLRPTVLELRTGNYLAATYSLILPDSAGAPVFRVDRLPAACLGLTCDIEYYVGATTPLLNADGHAAEGVLSRATAKVGATAGYSESSAPTVITGRGGWTYPNPQGGGAGVAGILATYKTFSASGFANYLQVGDARDPNLAGNLTIAGASTLNGVTQVNNTLGVTGAATMNAAASVGTTLTVGGATTLNGPTQVNSTLGVSGAATMNAAASVGTSFNVGGATTLAGATQINNTLGVTGAASVNRLVPTGLYGLGTACAEESAIARATAGGAAICSGGIWRQLFLGAAVGAACAPNGSDATDAASAKLTCINGTFQAISSLQTAGTVGVPCASAGQTSWDFSAATPTQLLCRANPSGGGPKWYRLQDVTTNLVFVTAVEVGNGSYVPKPLCSAAGGQTVTPILQLIPKTESSNDVGFNRYGNDIGAGWTIVLTSSSGFALGVAIAQTFCYYN